MNETLVRAQQLHLKGRFSEAEALYREVLHRHPDSLQALQGSGALAYQQGRPADAAGWFSRLVALQPNNPRFHSNLGEFLRLQGRSDEAVSHLREALALDPTLPDAWNSMGLVACDQRRYEDAEAAYREAIRLQPQCVPAYNNLAKLLLARGSSCDAAAALRLGLQFDPNNPVALTNLGYVLCEMGDPELLDEAEALCRRAVDRAPQYAQALDNLGNALRLQGRFAEATDLFQRSLKLDPCRPAPYLFAGRLMQQLGKYDEAARYFAAAQPFEPNAAQHDATCGRLCLDRHNYEAAERRYRLALGVDPDFAEAHQGLGMALLDQGRLGEAEAAFRQAMRSRPTMAAPWTGLARLQAERGEFDESCQSARTALALRPKLAEAYYRLATNLRGELPEADLRVMEGLLTQKYLPNDKRAWLHFGAAVVHDARGLDAQVAALLETANALQSAAIAARGESYDPDEHSRFTDRLMAGFTPELAARGRAWVEPDPRPVFVVGLPRSGTTLVEQILATHPQVHGAGELPDVFQVFRALPALIGDRSCDPFQALEALSAAPALAAARRYLERLEMLAPPAASRVVDKMPENIQFLGLIALLWPGARVILCMRDVRDIAVSCWQTCFESLRWAYDPDHIARRIADHERILGHWRRCQPLEWLELRYEDLVCDLETQARRMLDFVGLEWDPACLEFHLKRRVVRTASLVQVRQPLHSHSLGKWRRYKSLLRPLVQALQKHGVPLRDEP